MTYNVFSGVLNPTQSINQSMHLKCFKRRRAQELTDAS